MCYCVLVLMIKKNGSRIYLYTVYIYCIYILYIYYPRD